MEAHHDNEIRPGTVEDPGAALKLGQRLYNTIGRQVSVI